MIDCGDASNWPEPLAESEGLKSNCGTLLAHYSDLRWLSGRPKLILARSAREGSAPEPERTPRVSLVPSPRCVQWERKPRVSGPIHDAPAAHTLFLLNISPYFGKEVWPSMRHWLENKVRLL
jgi:hypothetical protein